MPFSKHANQEDHTTKTYLSVVSILWGGQHNLTFSVRDKNTWVIFMKQGEVFVDNTRYKSYIYYQFKYKVHPCQVSQSHKVLPLLQKSLSFLASFLFFPFWSHLLGYWNKNWSRHIKIIYLYWITFFIVHKTMSANLKSRDIMWDPWKRNLLNIL